MVYAGKWKHVSDAHTSWPPSLDDGIGMVGKDASRAGCKRLGTRGQYPCYSVWVVSRLKSRCVQAKVCTLGRW